MYLWKRKSNEEAIKNKKWTSLVLKDSNIILDIFTEETNKNQVVEKNVNELKDIDGQLNHQQEIRNVEKLPERRSNLVELDSQYVTRKAMVNNENKLKDVVRRLNLQQKIRNMEKFPQRSQNSIVIAVQVHKRANYLSKLLQSLREANGISDALLIVSHDYYSNEINNIVHNVDFCQVLQIFFPYSEQLNPDKFPGSDPNDCPRDLSKTEARAMGCNNAEYPDSYGHYREVKFTMTKHHWWWKINRIFKDLWVTRNHRGLVLLLEEDHYVAPDFYKVLQKAYHVKQTDPLCREHACDIVTLGDYRPIRNFHVENSRIVRIQPWVSTKHNMGMALDKKTWEKIIECGDMFCKYDDYNWDWSLMRMSLRCFSKPLKVLLFRSPRVFHLGTCGLHHRNSNCDINMVLDRTKEIIEQSNEVLNPSILKVELTQPWIQGYIGQPNGGWGDKRDHDLCLNFTISTN